MNRIALFILLGFRSMPVMAKILMPFFSIAMMLMFSFEASPKASMAWFAGLMSALFIAQPFAIAEKNRLETLHAMLSLTRNDVVKAKYLCFICVLAVIMLPPLLLKPVFSPNNEAVYFLITDTFLVASFVTALLYPLFFKIGYGKTGAVISLVGIIFFVILIASRSLPGFIAFFALLISATLPVKIALGLILVCLSYMLSLKIYRNKDL
ncbi:MAG: ABC-2 transporter permease [Acidobacteriota bacterium]|nr:ABC-2 transporter permease [Acidobacteriota bacterium]